MELLRVLATVAVCRLPSPAASLVLRAFRRVSHLTSFARIYEIETRAGRMRLNGFETTNVFPLLFKTWEPAISELIAAAIKSGDLFLDVGAHIGYYSLLAHKHGAEVVAFEPAEATYNKLTWNAELNGLPTSGLYKLAIGDAEGEAQLFNFDAANTGKATLSRRHEGEAAVETVKVVRLDSFAEQLSRARVIKIDIEGLELAPLFQLSMNIRDLRSDVVIISEMNAARGDRSNPETWQKIVHDFLAAGFRFYEIENSYHVKHYRDGRWILRELTDVVGEVKSRTLDIVICQTLPDLSKSRLVNISAP